MRKWVYSVSISLAIVHRLSILFTSEVEWLALDFGYFHWNTQGNAHFPSSASDMVLFASSFLGKSNSNFISYDHFTELYVGNSHFPRTWNKILKRKQNVLFVTTLEFFTQHYAFSPRGISHVELKPLASSSVDEYYRLEKEAENALSQLEIKGQNNLGSCIYQILVEPFMTSTITSYLYDDRRKTTSVDIIRQCISYSFLTWELVDSRISFSPDFPHFWYPICIIIGQFYEITLWRYYSATWYLVCLPRECVDDLRLTPNRQTSANQEEQREIWLAKWFLKMCKVCSHNKWNHIKPKL